MLYNQDLTKGLGTGTSSITRVGNKIKTKYLKGSITVSANQEDITDDQGGEEVANMVANGRQYLRTTWRVVIVKDTQSNSTDTNITWNQVFSSGAVKSNEEVGGTISQDLTKGLGTGTSSITRVGNKVKCKYLKGSITITANQENVADDQGGEEVVNNTGNGLQYLRTTWRVVIVKDTPVK